MRKEKSNKTGIILITIFLALSMILSIFAIVIDNPDNGSKYNGYKFTVAQDGYKVKYNDKFYTFTNHPLQLEAFNLSSDTKQLLTSSQAIAVIFDPNASQQDLEFIDYARFNLESKADKPIYFAVTQESETYAMLPVLSCENATSQIPFIYFNLTTEPSISQVDNCIIVNGKLSDVVALEERIAYQMMGIMK